MLLRKHHCQNTEFSVNKTSKKFFALLYFSIENDGLFHFALPDGSSASALFLDLPITNREVVTSVISSILDISQLIE